MSKDTTKYLVGQPVFEQMIKILPHKQFNLLVKPCRIDSYYKTFFVGTIDCNAVVNIHKV